MECENFPESSIYSGCCTTEGLASTTKSLLLESDPSTSPTLVKRITSELAPIAAICTLLGRIKDLLEYKSKSLI